MEEHFWINPLQLDRSTVDGIEPENNSNRESRHSRSLVKTPSTEVFVKEESIRTFLKSAEVANDHIEVVKAFLLNEQYPHLEPDSLAAHQYEFLNVPEDITDSDTCLLEVFHYLQKYAVTFYQMLKETDELEMNTEYYNLLKDTKDKIVRLLCDIQLAIEIFELTPFEDVAYEMLPTHMKHKNSISTKSLRDFLVVRHYSNFLEFIINQKENFMRLAA